MAARKIRRGWPGEAPGYDLDIAGRTADAYFRVSSNPDATDQKSVDQQRDAWLAWTDRRSVQRGATWADDDESASPFRQGKERPEFARLRADIRAGRLDGHMLWFWSPSRQTRGDIPLDTLAAECIAHGIVWVFRGQVLNPASDEDLSNAERQNQAAKEQPRTLRADVKRGKRDAAYKGTPATAPLYGYRRVYETGADGQPRLVKGRPVIVGDEPIEPAASVVREIYARLEQGDTLAAIARSLEDRRIPAPRHPRKCTSCGYKLGKDKRCPHGHVQDLCQWRASAVRFIATNLGYIGLRIYQAESARPEDRRRAVLTGADGRPVPCKWPAMVTPEQYWRVQGILADASRVRYRSAGPRGGNHPDAASAGRAYVMVPAARCASCGAALGGHTEPNGNWYKCRERGCVSIRADWLETYAEDRLVSWLVLPEVRTRIWGTQEDADAEQADARAALERLNVELEEVRQLAERGELSPVLAGRMESAKLAAIETEQAKLAPHASLVLDMMGPDAADRWVALKADRPHAARQLMAEVATIYVHPGKRGGHIRAFDPSRVEWHWKIGPDATTGPTRAGCTEALAARRAKLEDSRAAAADILRTDPAMADAAIGRKAGCAYGTVARVRRQLEDAGEITEPGYRVGHDGKRYMASGNGTAGSPRVSRTEGTAARPAHVEAKRGRIRTALGRFPYRSHHWIGTELGVAHDTVASVCRETSAECAHGRGAGQGKRTDLARNEAV